MLNQLGVLFACVCVLGGAALLYQGFSIADASQAMELLAGYFMAFIGISVFLRWAWSRP